MSTENTMDTTATAGCAAVAGYARTMVEAACAMELLGACIKVLEQSRGVDTKKLNRWVDQMGAENMRLLQIHDAARAAIRAHTDQALHQAGREGATK